jgi:hypothetical protein
MAHNIMAKSDIKLACNSNCVTEKDILHISWNYFQLHAQQRLSFFNFFVIFSALMTTGLISTFQEKYDAHFIGIAVGLMLSLIAFVFWKIDERNKYLTKASEDAIKIIEQHYKCSQCYIDSNKFQIFSREEIETNQIRISQKKRLFPFRQISHSKSFNFIFLVYFIIGLVGAGTSTFYQFSHISSNDQNVQEIIKRDISNINNRIDKINSTMSESIKINNALMNHIASQNIPKITSTSNVVANSADNKIKPEINKKR